MPLRQGNSAAIKSQNIREFHTGKTYAHTKAKFGKKKANEQAVAVALSTARKYRRRADGGSDDQTREVVPAGTLSQEPSPVAGFGTQGGSEQTAGQVEPGLRDRAIGTALDWLRSYGHYLGGVNELGFDPTDKEAMAGFQKGLGINPIVGAYRGVQGLMDTNKEAVDLRRKAETMPGSEEEIYAANLEAQNKEQELAGQSLMTGLGMTGVRGLTPGEGGTLGAAGSKSLLDMAPKPDQFFHPYDLDPAALKGAKQVTQQKGSNPGGTYELADGTPAYIKTPQTPDHAYNEKLAAELYKLAGVPVADVKMTKFNGKPSIVSPIIPGKVLKDVEPGAAYAEAGQHHPADLWLGNYDWVGTGKDNMIIDPTGKGHRIDTGGALRYRAQGQLKGPDMWGPEVKPFDLSKSPDMADVMDFTPKKWEQPTAQKVSQVTDDQIKGLVDTYGPLAKGEKEKLFETLKARRDGVAKMYGVDTPEAPPAPPQPQTLGQKLKAYAQKLNEKAQNSKLNQAWDNLSDKLTGNTDETVAKAKAKELDQFKQVPFDDHQFSAQLLNNDHKGDPSGIANDLWNIANSKLYGPQYADNVVKHLPQDMWADLDAHLSAISEQKGHDPYHDAVQHAPDDWMDEAKWGDDPDHPAAEPPAPEGWGNDHGHYNPHEGDFKFTDEPHWWDDIGKSGTIQTPEKPPGGWTEAALAQSLKDRRFARALTPEEWQAYKPPTTLKKFQIPPQATPEWLGKARSLGANTNFVIAKGYSKHYAKQNIGFESTDHGFEYPSQIENPKSKSHGYQDEHANYFADSPQVANSYGTEISAPYFMIAKNPLEVYYPAFKRATPAKSAEHIIGDGAEYSGDTFTKMIHAAYKNGHDWLILHGVNDSGGGNHTQYLMLNHKGTVRGVGADLNPAKKWSPRPLDSLVAAAPVGYGAYKSATQKDDEQ